MPEVQRKNSRARRFLVYHLPAMAYATAIILMSSIPHLKSPEFRFLLFDKLAHFVEYAVFAFLIFRSFSHISHKITRGWAFLLSALFLSLFALLDELHQYFVPGRYSDVYDLIGDILGALVVLAYLWIWPPRAKKTASQT
jgi:VanZ family protein